MSDILTKYYKSTFTLKSLLLQLNIEPPSNNEILENLSTIVITFDFDVSSTSIQRQPKTCLLYEQMLYLIFCKINHKDTEHFKFHFLKVKKIVDYDSTSLSNDQETLKNKLLATENPAICYFLSSKPHDGHWWNEFFNYSTSTGAIMKHIILYGNIFRRLKTSENMYVQVCGLQFSQTSSILVSQQLSNDNKRREEKRKRVAYDFDSENLCKSSHNIQMTTLKETFEMQFNKMIETKIANDVTDVKFQLQKLGNRKISFGKMMYDRNFGRGMAKNCIYNSTSVQIDALVEELINKQVLARINLDKYENKIELKDMQTVLAIMLRKFILSYRTCETKIFLDCYCKKSINKKRNSFEIKRKRTRNEKRKRDGSETGKKNDKKKESSESFSDFVDSKNVYSFVRRCLMHVLEYNDENKDSCLLVGGNENFRTLCKFIKTILNSLRHDHLTINSCLDGIKTKAIKYLWPIKCDRYKRLVLMSVLLWLVEDFVLILIRSCFYVTETCATNTKIFFYLKETWKNIIDEKFNNSIAQQYKQSYNLERITEVTAIKLANDRQTSGIYMGRLLPKSLDKEQSEFRIISGSKALNLNTKKQFKINYQFISLHECLKYLVKHEPSLTGFAVPSHLDIQRKYSNFLESTTYNRPANINDPIKKWNMMKIDIQKCFDNIDIDEIMYFIKNKFIQYLDNDQKLFTIFNYWIINFDLDKRHLKKKFSQLTQLHLIEQKGFYNGIQDFISSIEENIQNYHGLQSSIFIPIGIFERNINCTKLERSLSLCFNNVLIKIHNQLFTRLNGIIHGSICSRIICDLYLGKIEMDLFCYSSRLSSKYENSNEVFVEAKNQMNEKMKLNIANELILRIVDDYLIICDSVERLFKIKSLLNKKVKLNHTKTVEILWSKPSLTKIEQQYQAYKQIETIVISDSDPDSDEIEILTSNFEQNINFLANNSEQYITWNGFNIDVHTLDIYFNFDKYFNTDLTDRICKSYVKKNSFYEFNLKYLRLFNNIFNMKLLITLKINRIQAVVRNLIDIFALSSIRLHLLLDIKAIPDEIMNDVSLQIKLILNLCYLGNYKIKSKLRDLVYDSFTSSYLLLKFICLNVFIKIFRFNKTSCFKLCRVLEKLLNKLNFIKCIRLFNASDVILQLNCVIDQQLEKFKQCRLK